MTASNIFEPTTGYYSCVQYCPDHGRAECANVGVILLVPSLGYIGGVDDPTNARPKRFFGDQKIDWTHFDTAKKATFTRIVVDKNYFRTLSDLERFVNTRANDFILTQPRACRVDKAPFLVLSDLFDALVREKTPDDKKLSPESKS